MVIEGHDDPKPEAWRNLALGKSLGLLGKTLRTPARGAGRRRMGMRSLTELTRMGKTSSGRGFPHFGPASAYLKSALGGIRTHDRRFRRPLLYPTELRALLRVNSALCDAAPFVVSPDCIPWTRKQDSSSKRFEKKSPYGRTNLALHHSGSVSMADEPPV